MWYVPYVGFVTYRRATVKIRLYFKILIFMQMFCIIIEKMVVTALNDILGVSGLTHPQTPSFHIGMWSCTSGDTLINYLPDMAQIYFTVSLGFDNSGISSMSTILAAYVDDCILMAFGLLVNLYEPMSLWAYLDSISLFIGGSEISQHI